MQTKLSNTALFATLAAPLVLLATAIALSGQSGTQIPATTIFGNTGSIRNDGYGPEPHTYTHGTDCVDSRVDSTSGFYLFRTSRLDCRTAIRKLVLDFSNAIVRTPDGSGADSCHVNDAFDQAGELDICGSNLITDPRFLASTMFRSNALTRGTSVTMPFSLEVSYQRTAFELAFESNLAVSATANPNVRVISVTGAPAELYKTRARGGRLSIGRFNMSFTVTVEKTTI